METSTSPPEAPVVDITSDGTTVWVNGEISLLGRFGRMGIDIHQPLSMQCIKGECLYCTHSPTTRADWDLFVVKMKELLGVMVDEKYMPLRFRG